MRGTRTAFDDEACNSPWHLLGFPLRCAECGGHAPLIRMSLDAFTRGKTEIWTYECAACGRKAEKTVAAGGAPE